MGNNNLSNKNTHIRVRVTEGQKEKINETNKKIWEIDPDKIIWTDRGLLDWDK